MKCGMNDGKPKSDELQSQRCDWSRGGTSMVSFLQIKLDDLGLFLLAAYTPKV